MTIKTTWTPELPPEQSATPFSQWKDLPEDSILLIAYRNASDPSESIIQGKLLRNMDGSFKMASGQQIYFGWIRKLWVLKIGREFSEGLIRQVAMDLWKFSSSGATAYDLLAQAGKERIENIAYRALMETKNGHPPEGPAEYVTSAYGAVVRVAMAIYQNTTPNPAPWHRLTGQEQERFIQIARRAMEQA